MTQARLVLCRHDELQVASPRDETTAVLCPLRKVASRIAEPSHGNRPLFNDYEMQCH